MGRKRKQFQIYDEPDAKLARADSEGDFSENGRPRGVWDESVSCSVLYLPARTYSGQVLNSRVAHVTHSPAAPSAVSTNTVTLNSEPGRVKQGVDQLPRG